MPTGKRTILTQIEQALKPQTIKYNKEDFL
jgi:hypothetical protein